MAKRQDIIMDVMYARALKQECEEGLTKVDGGIKWGLYSLYAFMANIALSLCAEVIGGIIGGIFAIVALAPMVAQFVFMVMAIINGGGFGKVVKMMWKIAKWAYFLIPFMIIDIIFALWILIAGVMMFFFVPVVFYLIMKRSYKKDLSIAVGFLSLYEQEIARAASMNGGAMMM